MSKPKLPKKSKKDLQASNNKTANSKYLNVLSFLNNPNLTLNTIQLLNLIDIYFDDDELESDHQINEPSATDTTATITKCYPCMACSKVFSFEHTLHLHLERRTIQVRLFCIKCNLIETFYNKCKLKYHIYSHRNYLIQQIYKNISIEPVTPVDRLQNKETQVYANITDLIANSNKSKLLQKNYDTDKIKSFLKVTNLKYIKCHICNGLFETYDDLRVHYKQNKLKNYDYINNVHKEYENNSKILIDLENNLNSIDTIFNKKFKFNDTTHNTDLNAFSFNKLKFSSRCSLIANINLLLKKFNLFSNQFDEDFYADHKNEILICPECGLVFRIDDVEDVHLFRTHLHNQCFYPLYYQIYKCMDVNCKQILKNKIDFQAHWTNTHIKRLKYCELCFKAISKRVYLNTSFEIEKHINEFHTTAREPGDQVETQEKNEKDFIKLIYFCDCQNNELLSVNGDKKRLSGTNCSFDNWKLCRQHYTQKINNFLFHVDCLICEKNLTYSKFNTHLLSVHKINKLITCPICGVLKDNSETLEEHTKKFHSKQNSAKLLNEIYVNKTDFLYQCSNCKIVFNSNTSFAHNCIDTQDKVSSLLNCYSPVYLKFSASYMAEDADESSASFVNESDESEYSANSDLMNVSDEILDNSPKSTTNNKIDKPFKESNENTKCKTIILDNFQGIIHAEPKGFKCFVCDSVFNCTVEHERHFKTHGLAFLAFTKKRMAELNIKFTKEIEDTNTESDNKPSSRMMSLKTENKPSSRMMSNGQSESIPSSRMQSSASVCDNNADESDDVILLE